ncbi:uncharacterized protein V6R79_025461 [Siganus canaliculatus]
MADCIAAGSATDFTEQRRSDGIDDVSANGGASTSGVTRSIHSAWFPLKDQTRLSRAMPLSQSVFISILPPARPLASAGNDLARVSATNVGYRP